MRSRLVLVFLAFTSANALAQREARFELSIGIGSDIARFTPIFKNDHDHSASISYNPTDEWGMTLYLGQQVYSLDRLSSDHESFVGGKAPQVSKTVTSLLVGYRYFILNKSKVFYPYLSVALGSAKTVSSSEGYYVVRYAPEDTVYFRVHSGQFLLGLLSLGMQVRPVSFFNLFAELQIAGASNVDLSPGPIAGRIGIGIMF